MVAHAQTVSVSSINIEILPLPHLLGAEVRCGDIRQLDDAARRVVKQAWLDNLVLLIRGQRLTPQELLDFAKTFGEIDRAAPDAEMPKDQKPRFHPNVSVVSNVQENGMRLGSLGDGEVVWHTDHSYHQVPISASVLCAIEVPPSEGRTGFINMYRAFESLPADIRQMIEGLTIKNDATYNSAGQIRRGMSPVTDVRTSPGVNHPAVRTHPETGFNALYLGRRPNAYINGLSVEESESLLDTLWAHTRAQPAWYNEWQVGDVVVWDNRCLMHRREPFDPGMRRIMYRAQCKGTKPSLDPNRSAQSHPRSFLKVG